MPPSHFEPLPRRTPSPLASTPWTPTMNISVLGFQLEKSQSELPAFRLPHIIPFTVSAPERYSVPIPLYSFTAPLVTATLPSMYITPLTVNVFVAAFQLSEPFAPTHE